MAPLSDRIRSVDCGYMTSNYHCVCGPPKFLLRKALPFVLIRSANQLAWCSAFMAAGAFITYLFFPHGAIPFVVIGILVGLAPTLIAALPYEIRITSSDSRAAGTRLRQIQAKLVLSMYQRTARDGEENGSEVWVLIHPSWRLPWREMDIRLLIEGTVLRIQGPRCVIVKLWKRLSAEAATT